MIETMKKRKILRKKKTKSSAKRFRPSRFEPISQSEPQSEPLPEVSKKSPIVVTLDSDTESDSNNRPNNIQIIESSQEIINITASSSSSSSEDEDSNIETITLSDDSVICDYSENVYEPVLDYIPIYNSPKRKQIQKKKSVMKMNPQQTSNLPKLKFTPLIQLAHPNFINLEWNNKLGLRPVIIDGSNVAFGFGNGQYNAHGIVIVVKYFLSRGHEDVVCFLPAHFRHKVISPDDARILVEFEKNQIISYTPSRKCNGKSITPYDDRFIVQYASERGGVIISNDGFRDLINEEAKWKTTIESRVINYTFARGMFMLPKDPLGPTGPTLDEMLRFS